LVVRYQELAFRAAYLIIGDAAEAEDAAQDAFAKAYAALGRFRPGAPFRPWMLRIVTNEARNRRKAASRRATLALHAAESGPGDNAVSSPETLVVAAEGRQLLLSALEGLREEDRLVISYRYFLDLSESEMAESLGCRPGTVKSRLSRALARLRVRLAATESALVGGLGRVEQYGE
jgi:RNA polymerase sigma factor (sigma-70 family)